MLVEVDIDLTTHLIQKFYEPFQPGPIKVVNV